MDRHDAYTKYLRRKVDAAPPRERPLTPGPAEMMEAGHRCIQCAFDMVEAIYESRHEDVPERLLIEMMQAITWSLDVGSSLRQYLPEIYPDPTPAQKTLDSEPGEKG